LHLGRGTIVRHLDTDGELARDGAVDDCESINLCDSYSSGVQCCFQACRQFRKGGVRAWGDGELMVRGINVHVSRVVGRVDVEPIATDGELLQRQEQSLRTYGTKWMGRNVDLGSIIMGVDAAVEEDHS